MGGRYNRHSSINGPMAFCNRTLAKAALGACFLFILVHHLFNSKLDSSSGYAGLKSSATQWPKRTHASVEKSSAPIEHSMLDNDEKVSTIPQYANNQQVNDTTVDNAQQNQSLGGSQAVNLRLNNLKNQNVIQKVDTEPTKRTATSSEIDTNINKINSNSSRVIPSKHDSNSNFNDSVVKDSGVNGGSPYIENIGNNKSSIESVNNIGNLPAISSLKLDVRINASPRIGDANSGRDDDSQNTANQFSATSGLDSLLDKFTINSCPPIPPNLDGPIDVDIAFEPLTTVEKRFAHKLQPGGQYVPPDCTARNRVAIIVPYRAREQHLPIFLKNIHSLLMKQQLEYGIYIVEQTAGSSFNRAALMNIGFVEAMKQKNWECMVFHDIDLLPMDDRNLYTCPDQPRHMSVAVDTFGFKLPYSTIFGGVSAMTEKQFRMVNGFSNSFWGWGGEDDDMSNRLKHEGFHIARYPINIARYTMLNHKKEKANPKRYEKLVNGAKRFDSDGLNSLHYQLVNLIRKPLYTWIHADITPDGS